MKLTDRAQNLFARIGVIHVAAFILLALLGRAALLPAGDQGRILRRPRREPAGPADTDHRPARRDIRPQGQDPGRFAADLQHHDRGRPAKRNRPERARRGFCRRVGARRAVRVGAARPAEKTARGAGAGAEGKRRAGGHRMGGGARDRVSRAAYRDTPAEILPARKNARARARVCR